MNTPLVSFIITYHNEPVEMVEQCIDSILAQMFSDWKLILVEGQRDRYIDSIA